LLVGPVEHRRRAGTAARLHLAAIVGKRPNRVGQPDKVEFAIKLVLRRKLAEHLARAIAKGGISRGRLDLLNDVSLGRSVMKTTLCDTLAIDHPIIAAPMGPDLSGPELSPP
jgi:hypothetical protein